MNLKTGTDRRHFVVVLGRGKFRTDRTWFKIVGHDDQSSYGEVISLGDDFRERK